MTQEETQILAMVECLLVWDWLSKRDFQKTHNTKPYKKIAINALYKDRVIHKNHYTEACPFCDAFNFDCDSCLWKNPHYIIGCCASDSPWTFWKQNPSAKNAKKVLDLLLSIEF